MKCEYGFVVQIAVRVYPIHRAVCSEKAPQHWVIDATAEIHQPRAVQRRGLRSRAAPIVRATDSAAPGVVGVSCREQPRYSSQILGTNLNGLLHKLYVIPI